MLLYVFGYEDLKNAFIIFLVLNFSPPSGKIEILTYKKEFMIKFFEKFLTYSSYEFFQLKKQTSSSMTQETQQKKL